MSKRTASYIKLGLFVTSGLVLLIITLYMIGKNRNIFGGNYKLVARFHNIQGLQNGNNVRYAGMDVGTVNKINMINDTIIEVELSINNSMKKVIRKNAIAFIVTDGLVGDKVVNITPGVGISNFASNNDLIATRKSFETEYMFRKLERTNQNISIISDSVLSFMRGIQDRAGIGGLIRNPEVAYNIQHGLIDLSEMSSNLKRSSQDIASLINMVKRGDQGIGKFIKNTNLNEEIDSLIRSYLYLSENINNGITNFRSQIDSINSNIQHGPGLLTLMMKNEEARIRMLQILEHVEQGTDNFNQNMEALKHSILLRGYFKKINSKKMKN